VIQTLELDMYIFFLEKNNVVWVIINPAPGGNSR